MDQKLSLPHKWFRRYLDETWALELMLERVKTLGDVQIEWIYFTYGEDKNLRGYNVDCYVLNSVPQKIF